MDKCFNCWHDIQPGEKTEPHEGSKYAKQHVSCPGHVPVDQRGHRFTGNVAELSMIKDRYSVSLLGPDSAYEFPVDSLAVRSIHECSYCAERPQLFLERDDSKVVADSECKATEGVLMQYDISFPSGKVVIDDDLRDVFEISAEIESDFVSYNTDYGQRQVVLEYAKNGVAYGPVGNTCPGVYMVSTDDKYHIANGAWNEDESDELVYPGILVASVCTDLWAYSIMDYELYLSRGGTTDMGWTRTVVDIKPGTYRFIHHTGERGFDRDADGPTLFAEFERIGD